VFENRRHQVKVSIIDLGIPKNIPNFRTKNGRKKKPKQQSGKNLRKT